MTPPGRFLQTLNTAFWNLHSLTWDGGVPPAEAERRAAELASWVAAHAEPGASILDVGCATGTLALALAAAGHAVTGLDVSAGMLRRARAKAARGTFDGAVRFVRGDLERAPAPDAGAYDVVTAFGVLQCARSPVDLLPAMVRAAREDGVVLIEAKDAETTAPPAAGWSPASRAFAPLKRWASRSRAVHTFTRASLGADVRAAGLRVVDDRSAPGWLRVAARRDRP